MVTDYLAWPADKDELIKISVYKNNAPVNPHRHDFIEIVFIARGSCIHCYHNTEVVLIPGDIFIVVPHEEHSYLIDSDVVVYNCLFYPEVLGDDWKTIKDMNGAFDLLMVEPFYRTESKRQAVLHLDPSQVTYMETILGKMIEEQKLKPKGFQLVNKASLIMLLTFLGRSWEKQFEVGNDAFAGKRRMLAEALEYIEQNLQEELKINELASRVYLSPHYFRKVFREVTGVTPIEYINKMRISRAGYLLEGGKLSVSQVSNAVGITDVNYFSRLFRSITGLSPSEFKKRSKFC